MSIYGMKPTFKDQDGYKEWRKAWKNVYQELSGRIRKSKEAVRFDIKWGKPGVNRSTLCRKLMGERVAAHKLCTVLNEAKLRMANITKMKKESLEHQAQYPIEVADCKTVDFHFNKKHLEFPFIPMWVVKTKGKTFYVHHVESTAAWTTRETPEHTSTKGSIRLRGANLSINSEGVANISS